MDIDKLKHIHFTGIKGVGMTALCLCVKDLCKKITGSDVSEIFVTDETLKRNNIKWKEGFGEKNLRPKPDLLVTTAAHQGFLNPEVLSAKKKNIPVKSYAEFMSNLANQKKVISVCGVGGKTTTSSIIATMLHYSKLRPSYVIGVAEIFPLGNPGHYDKNGEFFVCEADDYVISPGVNNTPKFLLLNPFITVVTNIEYDHPDVYASFSETKLAFKKFFNKIPENGALIACIDNPNVEEVIKSLKIKILTYGFSDRSDYRIINVRNDDQRTLFDLFDKRNRKIYKDIVINLPGEYNVRNATASFIVGLILNICENNIKRGIKKYKGCRRRFQRMGFYKGAIFYDDYAHHPSEIVSILGAARRWFTKRRIIAIFQPHTFSRTKALFYEFSRAFKDADTVCLTEIYSSARESKDETISSKLLVEEIKKYTENTYYLPKKDMIIKWLSDFIKKGDVVITLGAGDIFHIYESLRKFGLK